MKIRGTSPLGFYIFELNHDTLVDSVDIFCFQIHESDW